MESSLERLTTRLLFAAPVDLNESNSMSSTFMRCLFACASYDTLLKLPGNPRYATLTKTTGAHNVTSLAASRGSPAAGVVEPVLRQKAEKLEKEPLEQALCKTTHVVAPSAAFWSSSLLSMYLSISSAVANGRRPSTARDMGSAPQNVIATHLP
jgi:hypothetical protein